MTSYEYFKGGGAKEMPFDHLPKDYAWITGDGGAGWYWNFFASLSDLKANFDEGKEIDPKRIIMCKIKRL